MRSDADAERLLSRAADEVRERFMVLGFDRTSPSDGVVKALGSTLHWDLHLADDAFKMGCLLDRWRKVMTADESWNTLSDVLVAVGPRSLTDGLLIFDETAGAYLMVSLHIERAEAEFEVELDPLAQTIESAADFDLLPIEMPAHSIPESEYAGLRQDAFSERLREEIARLYEAATTYLRTVTFLVNGRPQSLGHAFRLLDATQARALVFVSAVLSARPWLEVLRRRIRSEGDE